MDDPYKYIAIEQTLQYINRNYISLPRHEMTINNAILGELLDNIIDGCQRTNVLFRELHQEFFYGGSYYKGLKIRRPDEYDIDVKLYIPFHGPIFENNLKIPRITNDDARNRKRGYQLPYYGLKGLHVLISDDDYLDTEKVMLWMHQILSRWLKGYKSNKYRISGIETSYGYFKVKLRRRGPAFTFRAINHSMSTIINFDFVPCFVFGGEHWPTDGFRPNPVPRKSDFFIVPKPVKTKDKGTRYWRMSFQEQERKLLWNRNNLKPALRLLKKMKDKLQHVCIASYFIKTVFLWEVFEQKQDFWRKPLSYVFMTVLKKYQKYIFYKNIPYFWYSKFNLIGDLDDDTLFKINKDLEDVIRALENNPDDECLVAKYLLSRRELKEFWEELDEN